jgi:ribonuclease HI
MTICSDSQADLEALQAIRTTPLVQQCQKALNDISTWHAVRLYWVPGHAGVRDNEIANELARGGRTYEEVLVVGWSTSIGYNGEVLAIPKDRLEN